MFIHYRTQGLILKKEDRGEADQLFTIYTKDFGKLEILGKAIRKISSKLRSGAEIFYLTEIEFIQGKAYKTLTDAIVIEKFENLRKDLKRLRIAYKISEILDNFVKGQEPDEKIWQLINEVFQKLNNSLLSLNGLQLVYYYFLWNFLSILGYQPELYNCVICQRKISSEKIYFVPKEGGIICEDCFKKNQLDKEIKTQKNQDLVSQMCLEIEPETVKILRIILRKNWKLLSRIKIRPGYLKSLGLISQKYFSRVLEVIK